MYADLSVPRACWTEEAYRRESNENRPLTHESILPVAVRDGPMPGLPHLTDGRHDGRSSDGNHSSLGGASHGQVRRSTSSTAPKSRMATSERGVVELKRSAACQYDAADTRT